MGSDAASNLTQCDLTADNPSAPKRVHAGIDYALSRSAPAITAARQDLACVPATQQLLPGHPVPVLPWPDDPFPLGNGFLDGFAEPIAASPPPP